VLHAICFSKDTNRRKQRREQILDQSLCITSKTASFGAQLRATFPLPDKCVVMYGSRVEIEGDGQVGPVLASPAAAPIAKKSGPAHAAESLATIPLRSPHPQQRTISHPIAALPPLRKMRLMTP